MCFPECSESFKSVYCFTVSVEYNRSLRLSSLVIYVYESVKLDKRQNPIVFFQNTIELCKYRCIRENTKLYNFYPFRIFLNEEKNRFSGIFLILNYQNITVFRFGSRAVRNSIRFIQNYKALLMFV